MWDTRSVHLEVSLPRELAAIVEEVQRSDPEFLSRVVVYGLTRRAIFQQLSERDDAAADGRDASTTILDRSALA